MVWSKEGLKEAGRKMAEEAARNKPKPTNGDRIRAMNDEELAEWLTEFSSEAFAAGVFKMAGPIMTKQERLDWLRQP